MPDKTTTAPAEPIAPPIPGVGGDRGTARGPRVRRPAASAAPKRTIPAPTLKREPRVRRTLAASAAVVDPPLAAPAAAASASGPARPVARRAPAPRAPRPAPVASSLWGVGLSGVGALLALGGLLVLRPVEQIADPWDPARVAVYALLLLAPAAVFWAVGQALRMGRFWLFGTLAWAAFGYVLIFLPPPAPNAATEAFAIGGFLVALFAALTAGLTLPLHGLGWALFTRRVRRQDLRRAVRQAALLALYAAACLGMLLFSLFNGLNALLLFVVLALTEFFFLSRG